MLMFSHLGYRRRKSSVNFRAPNVARNLLKHDCRLRQVFVQSVGERRALHKNIPLFQK